MQPRTNPSAFNGDIEISRIAYRLWSAAGRPAGRYTEFWPKAEQHFNTDEWRSGSLLPFLPPGEARHRARESRPA